MIPVHPGALRLVEYCQSQSVRTGLTSLADIKPRELLGLLRYLFIAEPREQGWFFRLCGTAISDRFGIECTGKAVHQIFEPDTAQMLDTTYDGVVQGYLIGASRGHAFVHGVDRGIAEAVHAPLLARDSHTVLVLGGVFFLELPGY